MLDTHTHAWGPPTPEHPWTNGPLVEEYVDSFSVSTVYRSEALLKDMDEVGVDEAVVVGYPIGEWTDNWYTERAAGHDRLYGVVLLDQFADGAADELRQSMAVDGVIGFRLGAICPYDRMWETFDPDVTWLRDAINETEFWEAARQTDAFVQILAHREQLDQAVELVETYPDLTYAFDHFAHADPTVSPEEGSFSRFADLAEYENVTVKVSEIPHLSNEAFPYEDMHDHVRWLLETFGQERVIWGSDYPNVSDIATYEESLRWIEYVDGLSTADREWITEKAFRRLVDVR
ncbi:amidohydrolase family protein [Halegenticoccus soli]|uniref:amidohydrolase family protein n=1 Tax=Halegenticoccus soli TaxID=1985678 RepID=UPI000C6EA93E